MLPPHVLYKETIDAPVVGIGHYEPLRHYAEVWLRLEPGAPGAASRLRAGLPAQFAGRELEAADSHARL